LGMAYATGKGNVKKNKKLALEFLNQAAQLGDQRSVKMLDMIHKKEGMFRHDS
jgi:TPR repeat protein